MSPRATRALAAAVALALLLGSCSLPRLPRNPLSGGELSVEREKEVTADIHRQIRTSAELVTDPIVLEYVWELGNEIVAELEPQPYLYRFFVIRDDTLNAFTIGGGYVYINTGTLVQAGDRGELAGLMSHEIAHVNKRHVARAGEGQGIATLLTLAALAAAAASGSSDAGATALVVSQGINVSLQLKNSRQHEAEADREGIDYMVRAGYDPSGMTRFFERILTAYGTPSEEIPPYLYTHPAIRERIQASKVEMARIGAPPDLRRRDTELARIQARLAQLSGKVAGGTGLQTRAEFDRSRTDPLLDEAKGVTDPALRDALLARAAAVEPNDPRVALARADLAVETGDLELARDELIRAVRIDPHVPLAQYQLGVVLRRLGDKPRAIFYLEQAASSYRPRTPGRRRAELEILRMDFPLFEYSELRVAGRPLAPEPELRARGRIEWRAGLSPRFAPYNPPFTLRWLDPDGELHKSATARIDSSGDLQASLDLEGAAHGEWLLEVEIEGSPVESHAFRLVP